MAGVNATVTLTEQQLEQLFCSACEGGSNYWAQDLKPLGTGGDRYHRMLGGFEIVDHADDGGPRTITVLRSAILTAVQLFVTQQARHYADLIGENDDAETGDVFLQLCCFGDVIYG